MKKAGKPNKEMVEIQKSLLRGLIQINFYRDRPDSTCFTKSIVRSILGDIEKYA